MKVFVNAAEMPLPSSPKRAVEAPTIEADRDQSTIGALSKSKLSDKELILARWVHCLGRGRHDFDEEGLCVDCDTPRNPSSKRIAP